MFLSAGDQDLPGALLLWQKAEGLADGAPLFASRKRGADGSVRAIGRVQAWRIVKDASERAQPGPVAEALIRFEARRPPDYPTSLQAPLPPPSRPSPRPSICSTASWTRAWSSPGTSMSPWRTWTS